MLSRPWPILLLAAFYWISPIFNIWSSAWLSQMPVAKYLPLLYRHEGWFAVAELVALPILAGFSIYAMKAWSYPIFVAIVTWALVDNYLQFAANPHLFTLPLLMTTYVLTTALVGYFLIPAVRAGYFDRRLRWWETSPRYKVKLPVQIGPSARTGMIQNLSQGGVLVVTTARLQPGSEWDLGFNLCGMPFRVAAKVVYEKPFGVRPGYRAYGFEFIHTERTAQQLKQIVRSVQELGVRPRIASRGLWVEFEAWFERLIHTGQGWIPELPPTARRPAARKTDSDKKKAA